jgi:hypothetical protein
MNMTTNINMNRKKICEHVIVHVDVHLHEHDHECEHANDYDHVMHVHGNKLFVPFFRVAGH